jgi:hypothetical protein
MSDLTSSPDPLTAELASRLVDGDLDDAELAAVAGRSEVAESAAAFRQLSQLVADVPPLDARTVDAMIASAVAEHRAPPVLVVPKLEDRRARRSRRAMVWVGAAAAAALVVVGIGVLNDGGSDDTDVATPAAEEPAEDLSTAAGAESATSDDGSDDRSTATEAPAGAEAPSATLAADTEIVPVDDAVALAALARDSEPLTGEVPCANTVEFIPVAYASFRGTDVVVMRNESGRLAYAFDLATCKQVLFSPIS